jgi:hypothetical protein
MLSLLQRDSMKLIKTDGTIIDNIKGTVSSATQIILPFKDFSVDVDDIIQRVLPNGLIESYKVLEPVYYQGLSGIPANYQIRVRNMAVAEAKQAIQNITVNQHGSNARVNINSTDNSVNNVTITNQLPQYLEQIRRAVSQADLPANEAQDASEIIDAIDEQIQSGKPKLRVISALVASLPSIASIVTIGEKIIEVVVKLHSA